MQRYTDNVINQNGVPVVGASILVLTHLTQAVATLYSDDGITATTNPVVTNRLGQFSFYAADGRYDMQISGAGAETLVIADVMLEDPQDGSDAIFTNVEITDTLTVNGLDITGPVAGAVTSVDLTAGTGISVSGGPITASGAITVVNTAPDQVVSITSGTAISATGTYPNFTIDNTAPDQVVVLTQGGTTTITGTYPNFTISSDDQFDGTVTSIDASGGTTGLSFSGGPVTGAGTLTLGGVLAVTNGGTGATSATDARTNLSVYSTTETTTAINNSAATVEGNALAYAIALG